MKHSTREHLIGGGFLLLLLLITFIVMPIVFALESQYIEWLDKWMFGGK